MEKTKVVSKGIGFNGMLTILFIGLKLCKVIGWSWWWVLSPLWISWGLTLALIAIVFIVALIESAMDK